MNDGEWKPPPASAPKFCGPGRLFRERDTGLYRGIAEIRGVTYDLKATVYDRDGRKEFAMEYFLAKEQY